MFIFANFLNLISNSLFLTGYITGNNTFPLPLDEKDEELYLNKLKREIKKQKVS